LYDPITHKGVMEAYARGKRFRRNRALRNNTNLSQAFVGNGAPAPPPAKKYRQISQSFFNIVY